MKRTLLVALLAAWAAGCAVAQQLTSIAEIRGNATDGYVAVLRDSSRSTVKISQRDYEYALQNENECLVLMDYQRLKKIALAKYVTDELLTIRSIREEGDTVRVGFNDGTEYLTTTRSWLTREVGDSVRHVRVVFPWRTFNRYVTEDLPMFRREDAHPTRVIRDPAEEGK